MDDDGVPFGNGMVIAIPEPVSVSITVIGCPSVGVRSWAPGIETLLMEPECCSSFCLIIPSNFSLLSILVDLLRMLLSESFSLCRALKLPVGVNARRILSVGLVVTQVAEQDRERTGDGKGEDVNLLMTEEEREEEEREGEWEGEELKTASLNVSLLVSA